jgi:ppGpp synthetase/RelA/SpoT-type nucleotidyltranferase
MHRLRQQLAGRARGTGSITAARLKRMESIRRKLARGPHTLLQMQDLAGCRVIVPTMTEVARLVDRYRSDPLY